MKYLLIIIFSLSFTSCMNNNYVPADPIVFENDRFKKQQPNQEFYTNLKIVLDFYSEDYKVDGAGVVLIPERLSEDKDLMMNYTKKASDPKWMEMNGSQQ